MDATHNPESNKRPYNLVMEVTPVLATRWLEGNTHNRPVSQAHVDRLAQDILNGRWRLTHQGVAFDTEGLLIDGQHRLWAIIEANTPVQMRVFYNEPPENKGVLDSGERRSNLDILQLTAAVGDVSPRLLATLRAMLAGRSARSRRRSPGEEADQLRRHRGAVDFAMRHLSSGPKGVANATVRAVVARACYSADSDRLVHFCDVMRSGMPISDDDGPLMMLWQFLVRTGNAGHSESLLRLRYAKTQWALDAFLAGKLPKRLCSSDQELFPLPEEVGYAAA